MGDFDDQENLFDGLDEEKFTRKRLLQGGAALVGGALTGPLIFTTEDTLASQVLKAGKGNLPYKANTGAKGHILFWHHWASPLRHTSIRAIIKQFNQHYPHISVTDVAFPFGDVWTKNEAAVAAGKGMPDVLISNRPSLWYDAGQHKIYEAMTDLAKRDKVNGKPYWSAPYSQVVFKNQLYGLPFELDCRVLYWNRAMFLDAGLNSNKGPVTWQDVQALAPKLDHKNGGNYDVVAFYPTWGNSMGIDGWVWTNRGDDQTKKSAPTLNSRQMIETGEWMKWFADRYGSGTINAISSLNLPGKDQFGSAHTAMEVHIPGQQAVMNFFGVQFIRGNGDKPFPFWGVGLVPHNKGGKSANFTGGFSLSMPRNKHRSKATRDATWEFTKYMSMVGQRTWSVLTQAIPVVINTAKHDSFLNTIPHWKVFLAAVALGNPGDRNIYDVNFPGDVIGKAQDAFMTGGKSVKDALDSAQSQALANLKLHGGP